MEYRIIKGSKGIRFMRDSKLCKRSDVPPDILERLERSEIIDTSKDCVFCTQPGTEEKTLNSVRYLLCSDHYQSKTTGEIAETIALMKS